MLCAGLVAIPTKMSNSETYDEKKSGTAEKSTGSAIAGVESSSSQSSHNGPAAGSPSEGADDGEKTTTRHGLGKGLTVVAAPDEFDRPHRNTDRALKEPQEDGRVELTEEAAYDATGYSWTTFKKWYILTVIFSVQVSMNFNTSVWPNALTGVEEKFGVSGQAARTTQMIFLVAYAFGSELWAPFSEEFGRWPILQLSLFLVNSEYLRDCRDRRHAQLITNLHCSS